MRRATVTVAGMAGLAASIIALAGPAAARDQIRIVGSSTVYPFSTAVAEQFGSKYKFATPVVESTGTGGGIKLFCAGVGESHPDITNASRRIKESEVEACAANGVEEITEVKIGFDGIVLANSKGSDPMTVTIPQIWLALAKEVPVDGELKANPYQNWSEIDAALPDAKIEILGPPPTSGTRDAFVELVMQAGCAEFEEVAALDEDAHGGGMRDDARGRRLRRGRRERQPDRAEDRGQSGRLRHLRLQLPRSEPRHAAGQLDQRRGADLREHRRRRLSGVALAVTSTSRTPTST